MTAVADKVKLSISIVHHRGREMLRDCLNSIFDNAPNFEFEVLVVDNVSNDGAVEMLEASYPQVVLIKNAERHGFGQNQNIGIQHCHGQYILVLNDDTVLHGKALELMCNFLDENTDTAVVGPKLLNVDGSLQISCYRFPTPLRYVLDNFLLSTLFPHSTIFGDYRQWAYDEVRVVDSVMGAAMLVRKSAIDRVGGFDEQFFMYFEEIDWQMRMHRAGLKSVFLPHAQITHLGGGSTPTNPGSEAKHFSEFQISSVKFTKKYFGLAGMTIHAIAIVSGSLLSILIWSGINLISPAQRDLATRQVQRSKRILGWWTGASSHASLSSEF
ncbi:MAG: glycosyltransferase family 2 protein [Cyanobacteria bacterium SZAS-4]|nr:glycosyltransferase family 2 protein [Cyanobacteria bacterium SZAS-4]